MPKTFTARDLGALLSDQVEDDVVPYKPPPLPGSKSDEPELPTVTLVPRVDLSRKVSRYRAGQAPSWAAGAGSGDEESEESEDEGVPVRGAPVRQGPAITSVSTVARKPSQAAVVVRRGADAADERHEALVNDPDADDEELAERRARLLAARRAADSDDEDEEDPSMFDEAPAVMEKPTGSARPAITAAVLPKAAAAVAPSGPAPIHRMVPQSQAFAQSESESESGSEESGSEYESDSSDDAPGVMPMLKPVFRKKEDRETIKEREEQERLEAEKEEARLKALEARKAETLEIVASEIAKQNEVVVGVDDDDTEGKPDDTDRPEEEADAIQAWKLRELRRLKREMDRIAEAKEEEEHKIRRSKMTEAELEEDNKRLEAAGLKVFSKEKRQIKFLQKYHHKGVFYMDEDSLQDPDDVRNRHVDGATGDDQFNKAALPAVMQKRNFGKKSQSKWTHLTAEDTTQFDSPWVQKDALRQKYMSQMAGVHGDLSAAGRVSHRGTKRERDE